jgi:hypothetical protein
MSPIVPGSAAIESRFGGRMNNRTLVIAMSLGSLAAGAIPAAAQVAAPPPVDLEECYLRVAAGKSTPDGIHLAREICDAVFRPMPRSLAIYNAREQRCDEWWFDGRGRHEDEAQYCSLEPQATAGAWKLACQGKGAQKSRFTFVALRESNGRLEHVGTLKGRDPGLLFTSLAACVEHRAAGGQAPSSP